MVGSLVDKDRTGVECDVLGDTSSRPWVISSIDEKDVAVVIEILLGDLASEECWNKVVLRCESPLLLAVFSMRFLVPTRPGVSAVRWVTTDGPWKLRASLNIPSSTSAVKLMPILRRSEAFSVLHYFVHGRESLNVSVIKISSISQWILFFVDDTGSIVAGLVYWVGGQVNTVGGRLEWIVVHGDDTKVILDIINEIQNLVSLVELKFTTNVEILTKSVPR